MDKLPPRPSGTPPITGGEFNKPNGHVYNRQKMSIENFVVLYNSLSFCL